MTTSCTTITYSHLPMRRPAGKPGTPRSKSLKANRFTTISDDHVVCNHHASTLLQRLQRHTRSVKKRGRRSTLATTQRRANMATKRSQHRRWYRWCKSNVGYFEEGLDRRRQGSGSLTCSKATASQPLKDTRNAGSCAYEDHTENRKRSPHLFKLCHGTSLNIATLNACSLLKPSMHHQIIQYMKSKRVDVLCLQETKAKRTSYYMIDSFTFYTFSNASPDQQEHYGTGFV